MEEVFTFRALDIRLILLELQILRRINATCIMVEEYFDSIKSQLLLIL